MLSQWTMKEQMVLSFSINITKGTVIELEYEDLIFSLHILFIIEDGLHELLEPEKMFFLQKRDNFSFT